MRTAVFNPPVMQFGFDPKGDPKRPWVIQGEHTFCDGMIFLSIDDGFRTDLASVPWFLGFLFPNNGSHQRAAVHHDAAYEKQHCSRFSADAAFRAIMASDGVPKWRRRLMYMGVRVFGRWAWKSHHVGQAKR